MLASEVEGRTYQAMGELAEASGLTLHAAMREALLTWTRDHSRPKAG